MLTHRQHLSSQEVKDLARLSVKNVLGLVRGFLSAQNLSAVGYRMLLLRQ